MVCLKSKQERILGDIFAGGCWSAHLLPIDKNRHYDSREKGDCGASTNTQHALCVCSLPTDQFHKEPAHVHHILLQEDRRKIQDTADSNTRNGFDGYEGTLLKAKGRAKRMFLINFEMLGALGTHIEPQYIRVIK